MAECKRPLRQQSNRREGADSRPLGCFVQVNSERGAGVDLPARHHPIGRPYLDGSSLTAPAASAEAARFRRLGLCRYQR